ncbi:hypothetical protein GmHk_12G034886 [Glycine max]|nr:hypothetical protein GmHk_12G034886 [Glycine max]
MDYRSFVAGNRLQTYGNRLHVQNSNSKPISTTISQTSLLTSMKASVTRLTLVSDLIVVSQLKAVLHVAFLWRERIKVQKIVCVPLFSNNDLSGIFL